MTDGLDKSDSEQGGGKRLQQREQWVVYSLMTGDLKLSLIRE